MSGRPVNEDRQNAIDLGLRTYTGAAHVKCGTTTRYVAGGGCVHCARVIASEQRDARKFLLAQSALAQSSLDKAPEDGLDAAERRREESFDDLM